MIECELLVALQTAAAENMYYYLGHSMTTWGESGYLLEYRKVPACSGANRRHQETSTKPFAMAKQDPTGKDFFSYYNR